MDDLISRAAAIEYLMTNMGWHDDDGYEVEDADEKRKVITDLVNGIPAVDAVPVVRCRDCKHSFENAKHIDVACEMSSDPDFYCAAGEMMNGERKEDE